MTANQEDSINLFIQLDEILSEIPPDYFKDPREFRSLIKVLEVLNERVNTSIDQSAIDVSYLQQKLELVNRVIEEVVTFQHGGLNNSLDTMSEVVKEYSRGQEEIRSLRQALSETQKVLTAKKVGQTSLRDLWARKVELQESLKLVKELEELKNVPSKVSRLMQQKRFYSAVSSLNKAMDKIFSEDLSNINGLTPVLQQVMELKERLLTETIDALKDAVLGYEGMEFYNFGFDVGCEDDMLSDTRSESALSYINGSVVFDDKSVISHSRVALESASDSADLTWSTDLQTFDEGTEAAAIMDSNACNNTYIRLLVKTIGSLQCEDDAERLLMERFPNRFCDHYIKNKRSHIKKQLSQLSLNVLNDDGDLLTQGKFLGKYISFLLDAIIGIVRRFSYVLKLFSVSKSYRGVVIQGGSFLDLFAIWNEMEEMVTTEIKLHLVECDVEQISDHLSNEIPSYHTLDEDSSGLQGERTLFRPSSRHAASLFRRIVEYSGTSCTLMKDFFGMDHSGNDRPLLQYIQQFLESEFIPLIQSSVNKEIREITINVDGNFQHRRFGNGEGESGAPCLAAYKTSLVAESLLMYYQELFQHRDMVVVVLDRLIRGFLAAGRDHMETTLFNWPFLSSIQMKTAIRSIRSDPLYNFFRHTLFGGKQSLEESLGLYVTDRTPCNSDVSLTTIYVAELTSLWDEKVWDVGNPQYKKLSNLVMANELHVIETLGVIVHGVEWLIRRLSSIVRRTNTSVISKSIKEGNSKYNSKMPIAREESLKQGILPPMTDLTKIVDEIISVLRISCEVHCFMFVHELTEFGLMDNLRCATRRDPSSGLDFSSQNSDEGIIIAFVQKLSSAVDIISGTYTSVALASVVGPVSVLVPRLLLNHLLKTAKPSDLTPQMTTRLLRLIVAVQQHLSMFYQTVLGHDLEAKRKLIDCLTEECERLRRYVSKVES